MKFLNIEDLREKKKEIINNYKGEVPSYILDYFDEKEKNFLETERIYNIRKEKFEFEGTIGEYSKKKIEEYWSNNDNLIVKKEKRVGFPDCEAVWPEPPRNEERAEEERDLTEEEVRALIKLCEDDIYLFAVRYFPHYLKKPSSRLHKYIYEFINRMYKPPRHGVNNKRKPFKKAIAAPRGAAKCVDEDTEIILYSGKRVKIKDIQIGDSVCSYDNNYKSTVGIVLAKEESGKKSCISISTRGRKNIVLTKEHKVLTFDGWKKAGEITENDYIASPRSIICDHTQNIYSDEEVKLCAYLLAEGSLTRSNRVLESGKQSTMFNCHFTNADDILVDDFKKCCDKLGFSVKKVGRYQYSLSGGIRGWCRNNKLAYESSLTKRIPDFIFNCTSKQKELFISVLIDTDGFVTKNKEIAISLANEQLVKDIQIILYQLGILSFIYFCKNDFNSSWKLSIDNNYVKEFSERIPCLLKKDRMIEFSSKKRYSLIDLYPNKIKKFYRNIDREFRDNKVARLDNKYEITNFKFERMINYKPIESWLKFKNADLFWDKVVKIEDAGIRSTYDIQVNSNNDEGNFVGNGLITHNSTLISAIFPIWCTVYNKKRFILLISDTAGQAEDFLADIKREFEANELLKRDFPHASGQAKTWRLDKIITSNDVQILALGTGNKVRGRRFGIYRPDLAILDDCENSEDVKSESRRKFIRYEWFNKDLMFIGGEEGNTTDFLIVGTILGKESLLNNLLNPEEYPDWNGIKFQAIEKFHDPDADSYWEEWEKLYKDVFDVNRKETALKFFEEHKGIMLKGTQVLWSEGSSYYENYCVKVSDLSGFYSERQNDPKDPSKILVTEDQIHKRNFKTDARIQKILFDRRTKWFGALDPSLGKKADIGDYSCIVTVCVDFETGNILVPDIDMKRRPVDNQILAILKHHIDFKYKLFGVETNMFQLVIADNLRKISKRENIYVPIEEVTNYYDKKARIESIVPLLKDGTVIFDSHAMKYNQSYKIAMDQLTSFTGIGDEHDDFPDCLEIAISIAKAKKFKPLYRVNKK